MKIHLFLLMFFIFIFYFLYSGFSVNEESPKWNNDPRTRVGLDPVGQYIELPQETGSNYSEETRFISTSQGIFSVGPNFRVHPSLNNQAETPITRHPFDPKIMFASAITYNVGGNTFFSCGHYVTTNGGVSWFGDDTTVFNYGDPAPVIDYTGRLLISYITSTGSLGASYSTNNGVTWTPTYTFPGATNSSDKNFSATDANPSSLYYGRSYTVFTDFAGNFVNRILMSYTTNQGVSWSNVTPVSPVPSAGRHHQGCDIAVRAGGEVYVVWSNCITNGQNSTEDSLGFAKSSNGGVTWYSSSNHAVNTNGIRTSGLLPQAIRANGLPRIDVDKTSGQYRHNIYVVTSEKYFNPAVDSADVVLMRSTDFGSTWSRKKVNQNTNNSFEYFPAVRVDETGAVNICYYSTRNVPTNDSAEIYLSRSIDGGLTFTDVKISDHKFKPLPISAVAPGFQGDYIGITSGGYGKILPYWSEQGPASSGRYQAWTSLVDISKHNISEDFSDTDFNPTDNLYLEHNGTQYWSRQAPTAYNTGGAGSAMFNSWSAPAGTIQSLCTYQFTNVQANSFLTFDVAYAPKSGGTTKRDSLIIETSTNGGSSFTILQRLWGGLNSNAGPLNTVFTGKGQFTPEGGQWSPRIYALPAGTNKIRLKARSGAGNNIWLDNISVQSLPAPVENTISILSEGMWIEAGPLWRMEDTIKVYYHRTDFPEVIVDSAVGIVGTNATVRGLFFNKALSGSYFKVVKHRNSIETWSFSGVLYTRGTGTSHYDFTQPDGAAYANNQAAISLNPVTRGMYSGDLNQNGFIDLTDVSLVYNDVISFVTGYKDSDVTGDNTTDLWDQVIVYNNNSAFVVAEKPIAVPTVVPYNHKEKISKNGSSDNTVRQYEYF